MSLQLTSFKCSDLLKLNCIDPLRASQNKDITTEVDVVVTCNDLDDINMLHGSFKLRFQINCWYQFDYGKQAKEPVRLNN